MMSMITRRSFLTGAVSTVAIGLLVSSLSAQAADIKRPVPDPPNLGAKSYVLMDYDSGQILVANNEDDRYEPASLTKMMTSYIISDELEKGNLSLSEQVRISEKAWRMGGSKMFVEVNKNVSVEDLLKGMVIQSGNDASVALAEHVAGGEQSFADLMNAYAQHLGMVNTNFRNATGMPADEHYSSAKDMALLAQAMIKHFPEEYKYYRIKEFTYNKITQKNRNILLWRDESVDGLKTGHTNAAGYCLVSSAKRDGMRLISVVMGARSAKARASETQRLLTYGFRFFETRKLYDARKPLDETRVWMGDREDVPLGVLEDVSVTIPRGQYDDLQSSIEINPNLEAPIERGTALGQLRVTLGNQTLLEKPLVALVQVNEGGIIQKAKDSILRMFE